MGKSWKIHYKWAIFNCYVSSPEGICFVDYQRLSMLIKAGLILLVIYWASENPESGETYYQPTSIS